VGLVVCTLLSHRAGRLTLDVPACADTDASAFPQSYILTPYTAAQAPLRAELTARFPERGPDEIDALERDHGHEIGLLEVYLEDAGLEARVKEVAELVKRDMEVEDVDRGEGGNGVAEDVDM
jgi:nuclear pore complex protein Nup133